MTGYFILWGRLAVTWNIHNRLISKNCYFYDDRRKSCLTFMLMCSKVKYKVKFGCGIAVQRSDTSLNTDGISSADEQARPGGYSAQRKYNC